MIHAISFDIEEYFHVHAYFGAIQSARWEEYPTRVGLGTQVILDVLGRANVRSTCFVLGWVARRHPDLVHSIVAAGHELASHGYNHQRVDAQTPDEFRNDIRSAKAVLQDIAGVPVTSYRAPSFSITERAPWAHEILVEEGHAMDSSMAAGRGSRSLESAAGVPFVIETKAGPLLEFPLPASRFIGVRVPVGGGGYFRLFPEFVTHKAIQSADNASRPFCVYLHPWEFDPDQPRITKSAITTFRHRVGIAKTTQRLERVLKAFPFDTLSESAKSFQAHQTTNRELAGAPS